ncbi:MULTISPECIES: hypothetical protein [Clostridia]|nr:MULTISPECIES: hypothetical protein [Clostridia]
MHILANEKEFAGSVIGYSKKANIAAILVPELAENPSILWRRANL